MKKLFEIQIRFFIGEFVVNLSHSEKIESIVNFTNPMTSESTINDKVTVEAQLKLDTLV